MVKRYIEANNDSDLITCLKMLEGLRLECSATPLIMVEKDGNQIYYDIEIKNNLEDKEFEDILHLYKCLISK